MTDYAAGIAADKAELAEKKETRQALWDQLHANLAEQEPLREKERAIREQIRPLQLEIGAIEGRLSAARKATKA